MAVWYGRETEDEGKRLVRLHGADTGWNTVGQRSRVEGYVHGIIPTTYERRFYTALLTLAKPPTAYYLDRRFSTSKTNSPSSRIRDTTIRDNNSWKIRFHVFLCRLLEVEWDWFLLFSFFFFFLGKRTRRTSRRTTNDLLRRFCILLFRVEDYWRSRS